MTELFYVAAISEIIEHFFSVMLYTKRYHWKFEKEWLLGRFVDNFRDVKKTVLEIFGKTHVARTFIL